MERARQISSKITFFFLMLFCFFQCISVKATNIALGLTLFSSCFLVFYEWRVDGLQTIRNQLEEYKYIFFAFLVFWIVLIFSALCSPDELRGLRIFLSWFFFRTLPFFIIILIFPTERCALIALWLSVFSCVVDVAFGFTPGLQTYNRFSGRFTLPMTMAGFLCIVIPTCFGYVFRWQGKKSAVFGSVFLFVFFMCVLFLNGTRGAWLALFLTLSLMGILYSLGSRKKLLLFVSLVVIISVGFCSNQILIDRMKSITSTTYTSNTERLLMWGSAYKMFQDHPLLGVGLGEYKHSYHGQYVNPKAREKDLNHAHSNLFQMLGENGLLGLMAFLGLCLAIFLKCVKAIKKAESGYGLMALGVFLAYFLQGLTEYNFGNIAVFKYFWTVLGCLFVLTQQDSTHNLKRHIS